MTSVQGTAVDIPTEDGISDAYLARPGDGLPRPGVLLYQDAYGLRPHLKSMADRLAGAGYTVLVPNVFYRHGRAPVFELPDFIDTAARPQLWDAIGPVLQSLTPELATRDAPAYLRALSDRPETADGPVAVTGYCMGARLALFTAGAYPDRVAAAAGFHGGRLATDAPDSPHLAAEHITAELYFGHADDDPSLPTEQIDRFDAALTAAGVRHRCEVYGGAHHGFTQADTSEYDRVADERHWAALLDLLKRTF
ncbi:dienelactone hydrolase family protein [Streptomyces fulvoviolaceus]|uniref:dienelactone hydrolase family protein n=1 Tax=Streptomyces fulvoviolaceus TaxID=285535 RepID=UPI0021BE0E69|nr:dienelactone hydrolase family protein [Streptomyces fulvoviolaceus]MCT9075694.1 dienelactone hydrolase family protein [Streptomyces fulvoviolaceus]